MKIGELAERTGVPARMIRYYEAQGLLAADRATNGYRVYTEADVDRVRRIRNHISTGLPTRLVRIVFEMEEQTWTRQCSRDFADQLTAELAGLDEKISCLSASRETISRYLEEVRVAAE